MGTRPALYDLGRCLLAAAPAVVTLGMLALLEAESVASPALSVVTIAWRAAVAATTLWLCVALMRASSRPRRDRRAFLRLQELRRGAERPARALVQIQAKVWATAAGQHVDVVIVATGELLRIWLPEANVSVGSFVVLECVGEVTRAIDSLDARSVEAGQRHERRIARSTTSTAERQAEARRQDERRAVSKLVRETEDFLRGK